MKITDSFLNLTDTKNSATNTSHTPSAILNLYIPRSEKMDSFLLISETRQSPTNLMRQIRIINLFKYNSKTRISFLMKIIDNFH